MKSLIDRLEELFIKNYFLLFMIFYISISILTFVLFRLNIRTSNTYAFIILLLYGFIISTIISSLNIKIIKDIVLIGISSTIILILLTKNYNFFCLTILLSMNISTIWIKKYHDLVIDIENNDPTKRKNLIKDSNKKSFSLWFSDTYYFRYTGMKIVLFTLLYFGGIFIISKFLIMRIVEILGSNTIGI